MASLLTQFWSRPSLAGKSQEDAQMPLGAFASKIENECSSSRERTAYVWKACFDMSSEPNHVTASSLWRVGAALTRLIIV